MFLLFYFYHIFDLHRNPRLAYSSNIHSKHNYLEMVYTIRVTIVISNKRVEDCERPTSLETTNKQFLAELESLSAI